MKDKLNITSWVAQFRAGAFDAPDRVTQIKAGWYDWFCKDTSLARKTQTLGKKLNAVMHSPRFNVDECYVFFKNNCPMVGPLYDDFRICDIKTGDVIFTIIPKEPRSGKCEVWGRGNGFDGPMFSADKWSEVVKWFAETPEA